MAQCTSCDKSVFTTVKHIVKGNVNAVFPTEETKAIAEPRLSICRTCPSSSEIAKFAGVSILKCVDCGCLCAAKTTIKEESCPRGLW